MKINIIVKDSKDDKLKSKLSGKNHFFLESIWEEGNNLYVHHTINQIIKRKKLSPTREVIDFLNLSVIVYTLDQLFERIKYGYDRWSRHFVIYLPVKSKKKWNKEKVKIEETLSFLSGDKYELIFRESKKTFTIEKPLGLKTYDGVSLLSGGLDSFLGAIEFMEDKMKIAFVSHHKKGNSGEEKEQNNIFSKLKKEYGLTTEIEHFNFFVQPQKLNREHENTQRARSIIFLALGILTANSYGDDIPLFIPENGYISLNVPLVETRIGSSSTKTTHPQFIGTLNSILSELGINNKIINPYQYFTKGEMLKSCKNQKYLKENIANTISCSKAGYYIRMNKSTEKQCGFCVPCIIRRAAIKEAKLIKNDCKYVVDITQNYTQSEAIKGINARIFIRGIQRLKNEDLYFEILKSGKVPGGDKEMEEYIKMFKNGLLEVKRLLQ